MDAARDMLPDFVRDNPIATCAFLVSLAGFVWSRLDRRQQRDWQAEQERRLEPMVRVTFEVTRLERQGFREYYLSVVATNVGQPTVLVTGYPTIRVAETDTVIELSTGLWEVQRKDNKETRTISTSQPVVFLIRCALLAGHGQAQEVRGLVPIVAMIKTSHGTNFETPSPFPFSFNDQWVRDGGGIAATIMTQPSKWGPFN